jgi:putative redox protein
MDKSKEVSAGLKLVNDRVKFIGTVDNNQPISIDYIPPLGDNTGYTSLELLLLSLSSCVGTSVLTFLRRMHKSISGFEVKSGGIRKEEHPTGFKTISLDIIITSPDVTDEDMLKVIKMTEDTYCPVWSMLKGNTTVDVRFDIKRI